MDSVITNQRYFILLDNKLIGTRAQKGFTRNGAERRARLIREAKPKSDPKIVEAQPYE